MKIFLIGLCSLLLGIFAGIYYSQNQSVNFLIMPFSSAPVAMHIGGNERVGFLPYWLLGFAKESYKGSLTTVSYFSLTIDEDGRIQKKVNPQEEEPGWTTLKKDSVRKRFNEAKSEGLTTSLTVFAGTEKHIDTLLSNPIIHAENLLADITPIMKDFGFSDLNLDIESVIEASASSQKQFTDFTQTLKDGLVKNNLGTLTVDVTVMSLFQNQRLNPKEIADIADRIVLMTYDYHYAGSHIAGPVSQLNGAGITEFNDVEIAVKKALEYIPREKLLLGIPLYGYEWETLRADPGSPVIPRTGKTASNRRVEEVISTCTNCIYGRDVLGDEPYIIYPEGSIYHQIYYTDAASLQKKYMLAKELGLAGVAYWAMGYEGTNTLR